jgi:hypothetical protein
MTRPDTEEYHILITGPYDACFIGPFFSVPDAVRFGIEYIPSSTFDGGILDELAKSENVHKYGALPVYPPSYYIALTSKKEA